MEAYFRNLYVQEATEHLAAISGDLAQLQEDINDRDAFEDLYGRFHTLKSISNEMRFAAIGELLHRLEDHLQKNLDGTKKLTQSFYHFLFQVVDFMEDFVKAVERGLEGDFDPEELTKAAVTENWESTVSPKAPAANGTKVHSLARYTGRFRSVRIDVENLDRMVDLSGELVICNRKILNHAINASLHPKIVAGLNELDGLVRELQVQVLANRVIPLEYLINRFPRLVRDLAAARGKEVAFVAEGGGVELDRAVLDEISEPLVHLIKNAVDHGLESTAIRKQKGKHAFGTVTLTARRQRSDCIIEVSDDGGGIDEKRIQEKANERMRAAPHTAGKSVTNAISMIFEQGFSTATSITDISGRGVGLPFVKQRVEAIGGAISVHSTPDVGTTFQIRIPFTMAILQALLIEVESGRFAMPLNYILGTTEIVANQIYKVNEHPVMDFRHRTIRLLNLENELNGTSDVSWLEKLADGQRLYVVVLNGEEDTGVVVDHLLGKHEIVVKPLDRLLSRVPVLAGATILGDGNAAFILDVLNLTKRSRRHHESTDQHLRELG